MQFQQLSPYSIVAFQFALFHRNLGVLVDSSLKFHSHIGNIVRFANSLTSNILSCTPSRDADFIPNIYILISYQTIS